MLILAIGYVLLIVFTIFFIVYFVHDCWSTDDDGNSINCENYDHQSVMLVSSAASIGLLFMFVFWLLQVWQTAPALYSIFIRQIWSLRFALRVYRKLKNSYRQYVAVSQHQPLVTGVYPPLQQQMYQHPTMAAGTYQSTSPP